MFSKYRYRGLHRGRWNPPSHWDVEYRERRGWFGRGDHRGEYVEDPAWKRPCGRLDDGLFDLGLKTFTAIFTPEDGLLTLPALFGPSEPVPTLTFEDIERWSTEHERQAREQEIRDIVNDELASTPVYTALRYEGYGRFGDIDVDQAEPESVCILVEIESD